MGQSFTVADLLRALRSLTHLHILVQLLCIPDKGMEDWDEQKLEEVVNQKHGELNKGMPATTIVSRGYSHRHGDLYREGRIVLY